MRKTLLLSQPCFDSPSFFSITQNIIKPSSKVFIINYANEPIMLKKRFNRDSNPAISQRYIEELKTKVSKFGVKEEDIFLSNDNESYIDFLNKFNSSNVLIICGGAPENLIDKLEELGVVELFQMTNKAIIGYSAGAEALLENLLLLPSGFWEGAGDYYKEYKFRKASARIKDLVLSYHYHQKNDIWLSNAAKFLGVNIVALTDQSGIYCEGDKIFFIGDFYGFTIKGEVKYARDTIPL